jgi:hypothetical protein
VTTSRKGSRNRDLDQVTKLTKILSAKSSHVLRTHKAPKIAGSITPQVFSNLFHARNILLERLHNLTPHSLSQILPFFPRNQRRRPINNQYSLPLVVRFLSQYSLPNNITLPEGPLCASSPNNNPLTNVLLPCSVVLRNKLPNTHLNTPATIPSYPRLKLLFAPPGTYC